MNFNDLQQSYESCQTNKNSVRCKCTKSTYIKQKIVQGTYEIGGHFNGNQYRYDKSKRK